VNIQINRDQIQNPQLRVFTVAETLTRDNMYVTDISKLSGVLKTVLIIIYIEENTCK
jgi:hypothetical protein